jgi:hypothetical protein
MTMRPERRPTGVVWFYSAQFLGDWFGSPVNVASRVTGLLVEQLQRYIPELFGGLRVKSIGSHTLLALMADLGIHDRCLLAILEVSATDAVQ